MRKRSKRQSSRPGTSSGPLITIFCIRIVIRLAVSSTFRCIWCLISDIHIQDKARKWVKRGTGDAGRVDEEKVETKRNFNITKARLLRELNLSNVAVHFLYICGAVSPSRKVNGRGGEREGERER